MSRVAVVLQILIVGLAAGAGYGLVGIGYSLIYRLTGVIHFALGELTSLTIFVTLFVLAGTGPVTRTNVAPARFVLALVVGLSVAVGAGLGVYWLTVRPFLRRALTAGWIGATVALAFALRGLLAATFARESYVFPDPFRFDRLPNGGVFGLGHGVSLPVRTFFVLAVGALLAFGANRLLTRTRAGLAMQAVASDGVGALVVGLPVDRLLAAAFAFAGCLAALAAVVAAPAAPVTVDTGALLGLEGLVAALLAGFGPPASVFIAGLGLGIVQAWITSFHVGRIRLGPAYRDVAPLAIAVLVMAASRRGAERGGLLRTSRAWRPVAPGPAEGRGRHAGPRSWFTRAAGEVGRASGVLRREVGRRRVGAVRRMGARPPAKLALLGVSALAPLVFSELRVEAFAAALYTMLAAAGLNLVVGVAGMPSLGQGAFMGIGAFAAAWLRVRSGWDPGLAIAAATAMAAAAGGVVALAAVRLRPQFVAVVTWLASWFVLIGLEAFPRISGGAQGLVVPEPRFELPLARLGLAMTPALHYELGLVLVFAAIAMYRAVARGPAGLGLSGARQAPEAARTLGIRAPRLQLGAFAVAAGVAGLAGSLIVSLAGVADPTAFGPLLSVELFVAVLLGGAGRPWAPVAGVMVLGVIPQLAGVLGRTAGVAPERFEPIIAAGLLVGALVLGRGGVLSLLQRALLRTVAPPRSRRASRPTRSAPTAPADQATLSSVEPGRSPVLQAEGMTRRFGGVTAMEEVSIDLRPGEVRALIGPNGSGKTTFLLAVAGESRPDAGRVLLAGADVSGQPEHVRVAAGIVHTPARPTIFAELSALQHVMVGATVRRRYGAVRNLLATPKAREESAAIQAGAYEILAMFGLERTANRRAETLSAADQRLLMLATAYATSPRVLLMDEPAAGMRPAEMARLVSALAALRDRGLALLLVDHNLQLVRRVALRVTVLDAGRVIAEGTPREIAANPEVVRTYLGPAAAGWSR